MKDVLQVQIQNEVGRIVTVPLATWENGLKLDPDWHVYEPPKHKEQPVAPVGVVELKKPAVPVKPVPAAAKPVHVKYKRKGK